MATEIDSADLRVLVFAPVGRDAALTVEMLGAAGVAAVACRTAAELVGALGRGAGALLLTEEAFDEDGAAEILTTLEAQPSWSALPLLVLTSDEGGAARLMAAVGARANLTVLQRPARVVMLVSAVRAALQSRERQYATRELLDRLREADRQKDEFLATVSHELRTPLNAIMGWTTLMRSEPCQASIHERGLDVIVRNAEAQKTIIDDLLDTSRIVTGKLLLDPRPVDLAAAALAAVESARPAALSRSVAIEASAPSPVWVLGDADRLQQIAWNLVSNAVKFTPAGGRVEVEVSREDRSAFLRVGDTGAGITPAFLPHLFERFRQADSSTTRRHGGLGLGLAIVRHLAELHGGSVHAESAGVGRGATFVVTFPAAPEVGVAAERRSHVGASEEEEPPDEPVFSLDDVRVLVVDDNVDTVEMMKTLLESLGAEVRVATSADEGLEQVVAWRPDVLVSDIAMPERDGFWLVERVRSLSPEDGGRTPAIALTALSDRDESTRRRLAGFHRHLHKPAPIGELSAAVAELAGRAPRGLI